MVVDDKERVDKSLPQEGAGLEAACAEVDADQGGDDSDRGDSVVEQERGDESSGEQEDALAQGGKEVSGKTGPESDPGPLSGRGTGPHPRGNRLRAILEAMIFSSGEPLSMERIQAALPDCPRKELKEALSVLQQEYSQRDGGLEIVEVANGFQVRTRPEYAQWIGRLRPQRFARLSRASLETLAIVAYRQPVTRAEIESIRGVDTGAVLGTLLERRLLRILGRKEVAGRPILYGTTQEFLELFGLKNLKDLPTLREIEGMFEERPGTKEGAGGRQEGEAVGEQGGGKDEGMVRGDISHDAGVTGLPDQEDTEVRDRRAGGEDPDYEEEITPGELDEILKNARVRLKVYEGEGGQEGGKKGGKLDPGET